MCGKKKGKVKKGGKKVILPLFFCHSDPERSEGEESHPFLTREFFN